MELARPGDALSGHRRRLRTNYEFSEPSGHRGHTLMWPPTRATTGLPPRGLRQVTRVGGTGVCHILLSFFNTISSTHMEDPHLCLGLLLRLLLLLRDLFELLLELTLLRNCLQLLLTPRRAKQVHCLAFLHVRFELLQL